MTERSLVKFGDLTITGTTYDGKDVTIEAPIRDLVIEVDEEYDNVSFGNFDKYYKTGQTITFKSTLSSGGKYTIKEVQPEPVVHTARVAVARSGQAEEVKRVTPKMVADAQQKAGVGEDTEFHFEYKSDPATLDIITYVEFNWTD